MAKGSNSNSKPQFGMTPELKKFQYELAQEIGLTKKVTTTDSKTQK